MKNLKIILDVDDVLGFTIDHLLNIYNKENDSEVLREHIRDWGFKNCEGIDAEAMKIFGYPEFFKTITPDPDAIEGVATLIEEGSEVVILTAGMPKVLADKAEWLKTHFPKVQKNNYLFGYRKDLVGNDSCIFIDDNVTNLLGSPCKHKVCMDRPWNRPHNHPEAKAFLRVSSFKEFVEIVRMLELGEEIRRKEIA